MEHANSKLKPSDLLKEGAEKKDHKMPKKIFMYMYTEKGKKVKNVLDIPDDTQYLLVSEKKGFKDVTYKEIPIDTNAENHESIKMKVQMFKDIITNQTMLTEVGKTTLLTEQNQAKESLTQRKGSIGLEGKQKPHFLNRHLRLRHPNHLSPLKKSF